MIQESVDTIYFLEEDTISTANIVLDNLLRSEIKLIASEMYYQEIGAVSSRSRSNMRPDRSPNQTPLTNRVRESSRKRFKTSLATDSGINNSQRTLHEQD